MTKLLKSDFAFREHQPFQLFTQQMSTNVQRMTTIDLNRAIEGIIHTSVEKFLHQINKPVTWIQIKNVNIHALFYFSYCNNCIVVNR